MGFQIVITVEGKCVIKGKVWKTLKAARREARSLRHYKGLKVKIQEVEGG